MKKLILIRNKYNKQQGTQGLLINEAGQEICKMLELPNNNNLRRFSCIPVESYRVDYMFKSASGKYLDIYHLKNVKGRSGILIHGGNFAGDSREGLRTHSLGCLLPCVKFGKLSNQLAGMSSKVAINKIHDEVNRKSFELVVV